MSDTLAPRCRVLINGAVIETDTTGTEDLSTTETNYAAGDSFTATIGYPNTQAVPSWADPPNGTQVVEATCQISVDAGQTWSTRVTGPIDHIGIDPVAGSIEIAGKDYSSVLMDLRIQEGWLNQRSGEVVASLAQMAGLQANVQDQGSLTGQYYQIGHKRSALLDNHKFGSAWDVIRYLANVEGCDAYMTGKTLNFVPSLADTSNAYAYQFQRGAAFPTFNGDTLRLERDLVLAKGLVVQVISWEPRQKTATSVFWSSRGPVAAGSYSANQKGQLYVFRLPGLSKDAAGARAKQLYDQIVAHQRVVTIGMPLDLTLSPRQPVTLTGTGTSFDTSGKPLRIDSIVRRVSFSGVDQTVVMRNRDVTEDAGQ